MNIFYIFINSFNTSRKFIPSFFISTKFNTKFI